MNSIPTESLHLTKASKAIYRDALHVLPGGVSRNTIFHKPHPHYVAKAKGCYVTDVDGVQRVDFANNMASLIHGHAHPAIIRAVTEQLEKGTAYTLATEVEVRYAEHLCGRSENFDKIRFVNSGTEAVMAMIKMARAFTGREKIAKAEGAYHGTYDFAEVSQMAHPGNWGDLDKPNSVPVAFGTPKSVLEEVLVYPFNDLERTLRILDAHASEIACVVVDLVPHRIGLFKAKPEFIEGLRAWTQKNGALLAFDEVVTFRATTGGAQQYFSVKPDVTALGKIIGGGFPVGAVAGRSEVMRVFDPTESKLLLPHSGTFSANPITMIAGRVAMELFDENAVLALNALTEKAVSQIEEAIKLADVPVSITGAGSMFRMHFRQPPPTSYRETYQSTEEKQLLADLLDYLFYEEKIMMVNTGTCMFSTALTQKEVDRLAEGLLNGFREMKPRLVELRG
ncbi:MAG: aspartate aminotransferase family protein [Saprospirales bacterium]|nr:aspartate aminotransferase family protein [Saprospirales bacterium]